MHFPFTLQDLRAQWVTGSGLRVTPGLSSASTTAKLLSALQRLLYRIMSSTTNKRSYLQSILLTSLTPLFSGRKAIKNLRKFLEENMLEKAQKFMDSNNYLSLLKFPIKFPTSVSLSEFNTALCWPTRAYFRLGFWSYSPKDNSRKTTKDIKSETNQPLCSASSQSYPHLPVEETQLVFGSAKQFSSDKPNQRVEI